jgi:hypothetical protein
MLEVALFEHCRSLGITVPQGSAVTREAAPSKYRVA